jgi:hypothetical protein
MTKYSMTCTCGHTLSLQANSREDAVAIFQKSMTEKALEDHMRQWHKPDDPKPTLAEAHAMIQQVVTAA